MKPKRLDIISSLPSTIVETILCLVPIQDAVRTSILARDWRYKWTKIPNLVFVEKDLCKESTEQPLAQPPEPSFGELDEPSFGELDELYERTRKCKLFYAIHQVLLLHDGPIFEFALTMDNADYTCVEIDQIITHLSRLNTLKKFKLLLPFYYEDRYDSLYRLPISIFLLHQLTHLSLHGCKLEDKPTFSTGLSNLTTLSLTVTTLKETLLYLLSGCPLLKSFTLSCDDEIKGSDVVTIIDIFKCLPMIEHLTIDGSSIQCFSQIGLPRQLSTPLVHLKYLCIEEMTIDAEFQFNFLGILFRSAPNLEKIKLHQFIDYGFPQTLDTLEVVSDIWLEHLIELEIYSFYICKPQLEFVKLILAKSPMLKKVNLFLRILMTNNDELEILRTLLRLPRTSPLAEVIVKRN